MKNPIAGMQGRFFQKLPVLADLNHLIIGRKEDEVSCGNLSFNATIRKGFFGGRVSLNDIPKRFVVTIPPGNSNQFPEGISFILPYKKTSPGYYFFHTLPLCRIAEMEKALEEKEIELESKIQTGKINTPEELIEWISDMMHVLKDIKRKGEVEVPEFPMTIPEEKKPGAKEK